MEMANCPHCGGPVRLGRKRCPWCHELVHGLVDIHSPVVMRNCLFTLFFVGVVLLIVAVMAFAVWRGVPLFM